MGALGDDRNPFRVIERALWKGRSVEARLQFIEHELFVPYPEFMLTVRWILSRARQCILQNRGACIFVVAPSGAGKTTLTRYFKLLKPDQVTDELTLMPVVCFSVPMVITIRGMTYAVLDSMGDPRASSGPDYAITTRVTPLLRKIQTEIVMIDNIQDIPEKRLAGGIKQIGTWIRDLSDNSCRLTVLLGTKEAVPVINGSPQLKRRSIARKEIKFFDTTTEAGIARFRRFVKEVDDRLPLAKKSNLDASPLFDQLVFATGGSQDVFFQLISAAIFKAVPEGSEMITKKHLAEGFEGVFADAGRGLNPFLVNIKHVIRRKGEPLYEILDPETAKNEPALL